MFKNIYINYNILYIYNYMELFGPADHLQQIVYTLVYDIYIYVIYGLFIGFLPADHLQQIVYTLYSY